MNKIDQQFPYLSHPRIAKSVALRNPLKLIFWPIPNNGVVIVFWFGVY
jgi:hypothetical protein